MKIKIFQHKPSDFEEIRVIQREFLTFLFGELNKLPWFSLDVENEIQFIMKNLDKFDDKENLKFIKNYKFYEFVDKLVESTYVDLVEGHYNPGP